MKERYDVIKAAGYTIDVRGIYPLLIKGVVAEAFPTFEAALTAAEAIIG